jgi:hypothetical protein
MSSSKVADMEEAFAYAAEKPGGRKRAEYDRNRGK